MRQSVRITNTSAPTRWILVQEIRYSFPNDRMVGQHLEGSEKGGILHLALEYEGRVTAAVCVFERREDGEGAWFDYRIIREDEGPVAVSYPKRLLDMLSPPRNGLARRWRASCRALSGTTGLDCALVEAGDHVFLPASSIPVSRPVAPHALLRCLSAGGGFVKAIEVDPSTGEDLGLAHLNLIAVDVRQTSFPVSQIRQSLALNLRRFLLEAMPDLSDVDDFPEFDSYMSYVWNLDGQPWRPKPIELLDAQEVEGQKAAVASGGLLLTFEAIGRPNRLSVELVFGPSGEAVAVDVGGPSGLVDQQGPSDCVLELLADLERRMNMPVGPDDMSYAPSRDACGHDAKDNDIYSDAIYPSM